MKEREYEYEDRETLMAAFRVKLYKQKFKV